jgi:hypothetical protein
MENSPILNFWPVFAVQRSAPSRWLVRAPDADPFLPAVRVVAVLEEPGDDEDTHTAVAC